MGCIAFPITRFAECSRPMCASFVGKQGDAAKERPAIGGGGSLSVVSLIPSRVFVSWRNEGSGCLLDQFIHPPRKPRRVLDLRSLRDQRLVQQQSRVALDP